MTNSKVKSKRIISMLLSLILVFSAFSAMPITASAYVDWIDNYYTDENGVKYDLVMEGLDTGYTAYVSGFTGNRTDVVIPSTIKGYTVNTINGMAFKDCLKLKRITIPDTVKYLGRYAFENCISLEFVDLGKGIEEISEGTFKNCQSLKSFTVPEQITYIYNSSNYSDFSERYPFSGCVNLTTINFNAKKCSSTMEFREIPTLTTLNIGSSVETLPNKAFYKCESIENVNIKSGLLTLSPSSFYGCTGITGITLPDSIMAIGESAFENCSGLKSVTLSNNLNTISKSAFSNCTSLANITFPDSMRKINEQAFENCTALKAVNFNSGTTSIGENAFKGCTSISNLTLPANLTSLGDYAFRNCSGITDIKFPNKLKYIGIAAFYNCTNLKSVNIPDNITELGEACFAYCSNLRNVTFGNKLNIIGNSSFYECTNLNNVTIPGNVKTIDGWAFEKCKNLSTLKLQEGIKTIGYGAFYNCTKLKTVEIPNSVTEIGNFAFGYYGDDNYAYKISGFTIKGYQNSEAFEYAKENDFTFIDASIVAPQSITIPSSLTLGVGEKCMPNYKIYPANAMTDIFYTTSNSNVVAYDDYTHTLTAKKAGTATVTIHTTTNNKTASCKITVKNAPSSVKTNPTSLTLGKGETYTISECTNSGSYASAANLKWSSSNTSVAAVTKGSGNKAKITAKGVGTAYIKITLYNGKTASCKVTVKNAPTSVKTNPTSLTLGKGETYTISESTNSGTYANAGNLKWSSSDTSVAAVTKGSGNKATITAKGVGTAYIKITLYNGKTASCKVTVKNAPSSVKLSSSSITLGKGKTFTVSESTNSGSYANAGNLKWSSSNTNVATVKKGSSNKAVITAKSKGTAYIKIALYNGKTAQCKVTVK